MTCVHMPYAHYVAAAFGWDSCIKGGWYRQLLAKLPNMQVR